MKVIAVDYDDTYTADPELFSSFIKAAQARGHLVVIVTARHSNKPVSVEGCEVFYTDGAPKASHMNAAGLEVDIWIDDWPELIGPTR
jgi:hypothetical protein